MRFVTVEQTCNLLRGEVDNWALHHPLREPEELINYTERKLEDNVKKKKSTFFNPQEKIVAVAAALVITFPERKVNTLYTVNTV